MAKEIIETNAGELEILPRQAEAMVQEDLPCIQCGYNLKMLRISGRCPKCGSAIRNTMVAARDVSYRELGGKLRGLTLWQQVVTLAIWPFMEQLLGFTVGFVDTVLAGHTSVATANALGIAVYVGWLMNLLQMAAGIGATVLISRATGGRHKRIANAAVGQAILLAASMGAVMGALVYILAPVVVHIAGLTGESMDLCVRYLRIISVAAPFSAIIFVGSACLRGAGDTRTPFIVLVVVNVVNAGLACTLVLAPPPWGGYGVRGMAMALVAAWSVGGAVTLTVLFAGWGGVRLYLLRLAPHRHTILRIVKIGLPAMMEMFLGMWLANFLVVRIVGHLANKSSPGAHMIAIRLEAISYLPGFAMGTAAATLAGMYLGLGDPARARRAIILCWRVAMTGMAAMGLVFIMFPHTFVRLTTNDPSLLELAPPLLRMAGFVQIFFGTAIVLGQGMRGAGDTRGTMMLTAASTYLIRLPLAYAFAVWLKLGLRGVWIGLCGELVARGLIFAGRFYHGGWMKTKI